MHRVWLALVVLAVGCGGSGKRVAPAAPTAWCYGCDGETVYAPNARFLIMTAWDATCQGGAFRDPEQLHGCDEVSYKSAVTCQREGGDGECAVTPKAKDQVIVKPSKPGTYVIAVTMKPKRGEPYHEQLGRVVVDSPDRYAVTCSRPKAPNTVVVRVETFRGDVPVLGPTPKVKVAGTPCDAGGDELGDDYIASYDMWCESVPDPDGKLEVAISSPALNATHTVENCSAGD